MVAGRVISEGAALNRGLLTPAVIEAHAANSVAKGYLEQADIKYQYFDVVSESRALYEMLARVKALISAKTPVTVPPILLDRHYIGGADELSEQLHRAVEPSPERGQCSLSASR